ncbi:PHD finger protein ALFIN-LIKE 5-like isoform X2 [Musa acuminata AAA Group]|uniref:PHD finger protein ALFIN-LIKE 5-like isoform X2 n=1 Tax=Musa acuminata AAA Group TaxID=214697 RepID=UPI0031CF8E71
MDLGRSASTYREAEDLFKDFRGRRAGMIKALTTDFTKFYQQCDPGINLARDVTEEKRWLADVACHSDAWLLSFSLYWSLRFGFDKETRRQLFVMINTLPTISEVFLGAANNGEKETIPSNSIKDGPSSEKASKIGPLTTTRDVSLFLIYSDLAAFQTGASNKGRRRR